MTALRRTVLLPVIVLVEVLILVTAPLSVGLAGLAGLVVRSDRPVRTALLVLAYAAIELRVLCRMLGSDPGWDSLMRDVADTAYRVLRRVLAVRVELEAGSVPPDGFTGGPVIVLARHCGPGDSLLIAWLIEAHYQLRLHLVLKSLLRLEPALDIAGDHLPLCFVGRRGRRARDRVGALADSLADGDALLLFPEGGNFSWQRWRRAVSSLSAAGAYRAARRARSRTHTLPPRGGGATAALQGAPDADVLLLTHNGFHDDGRARPWWEVPVRRRMIVRTRLVPAADVPRDPDEVSAWLDRVWSDVDRWVAEHDASAQPARSDHD